VPVEVLPPDGRRPDPLPDGFRPGLVRRRAQDLYKAISAQHHCERAVRELRNVPTA